MTIILSKELKNKNQQKGAIFSIEALISFSITLVILLLFIQTTSAIYKEQKKSLEEYYLEEKTLIVIDSLVKNYNQNNPLFGSCISDIMKKRVKSNELTSEKLNQVKPFELKEFFVKQLSYKDKKIELSKKESKNCITMKRFVLIDNEKELIYLTGCLNENT